LIAQNMTSELPPVVVIHGLKGSHLKSESTGKRHYISLGQLLNLSGDPLSLPMKWDGVGGRQRSDGLVPDGTVDAIGISFFGFLPLASFHMQFVNKLQSANRTVHTFTYDWRREPAEHNEELEYFIDSVIRNHRGSTKCVQVVAHSFGGLVTLLLLNRRPEMFHSVIFAGAAYSPGVTFLKDMCEDGPHNVMGLNSTLTSARMWLSCPSTYTFLPEVGDRNELGDFFLQEAGGEPVEYDLHDHKYWKALQLGAYNPNSQVPESLAYLRAPFLQESLNRAKAYRQLLRFNPAVNYPPIAVLRSDCSPVPIAYRRPSKESAFDFSDSNMVVTAPGDGRVTLADAMPPKGIPVFKAVTVHKDHAEILECVESIELVDALIHEAERRSRIKTPDD